ncbi:putative indole-3-acetic acid-amido synthetase GH3.9 isoform X2 [Punica granatum]|uniref:Indole-3-acetic acid-amido synthetase GH3.9 isoform X2 n=2 Tax=Punica granatum TaxID=22663 RepID=A0A6P8EM53_PUNGR|nr:putative indole-3-acetic acid-amido synthetase GH3.9 isoform X2 [Punica granatum]
MDGKKLEYKGKEALEEIERLTARADCVQEDILRQILTRNAKTEYLSKYMKADSKDIISEFKKCIPVITYKGIHPYIKRIANGEDSSLITGDPITEMLCRYISGLDKGKAMYLYFVKAEMSTPCGLPARAVLTSYYKSKHFKGRARDPYNDFTSPDPTILCEDSAQSMYCQLLAGLVYRHQVLRLGAVFASAFLRGVSFLERNWARLCTDICTGQLDPGITDPECRLCMSAVLKGPNPTLAGEIRDICSHPSWMGILCCLWPRAKYIEAVVTGSMAQYIPALEYFSGGKLPLVCTMYASSECYFGVNLKPLCDPADVSFTLLPNMGYFEFIPLGDNGTLVLNTDEEDEVPSHRLVDLVHVRLGCYYELVITTFAGLYRYRIGDVLQVTGFYNCAPQFRFICRRNVVLSIDNDKTNEEDLHKSITAAKKLLEPYGALLVEYTSYADTLSVPGHYVLYWEIRHHPSAVNNLVIEIDSDVLQECCISVEEQLDYVYRRCRTYDKSVGPLEIRVVKSGTFESLMDLFISQGGSINQYKTPRCIRSGAALKLLNSNVKASFFSPRDPTWIP